MPEITKTCPFTGTEDGWKEWSEEGIDADGKPKIFFHGQSIDGSHVIGEDQEGLDREHAQLTKAFDIIRTLVGSSANATEAYQKFWDESKPVLVQSANMVAQIAKYQADFKLAEAKAIVAANNPDVEMTPEMAQFQEAANALFAQHQQFMVDKDFPTIHTVRAHLRGLRNKEEAKEIGV